MENVYQFVYMKDIEYKKVWSEGRKDEKGNYSINPGWVFAPFIDGKRLENFPIPL